ncbi:MAG TPA: hypothetical protein PKD61_25720 [Polyangiaceae bacterium]|nr:hypothetical protein [Polyangiaceae bacterium]
MRSRLSCHERAIRRASSVAALALTLPACAAVPNRSAPQAASAPTPVVVPSAQTEPAAPVPVVTSEAAPGDLEIREPDPVACRLSTETFSTTHLRLSPEGEPFASVTDAPAAVVLGTGDAPKSAVAVLDDGRVLLRLMLRAKDTRIYTRAPTRLLGFLLPDASRSLDWSGGTRGSLRLGVDASLLLVSPTRVEEDLACDGLTITAPSFDARASVTKRKKLPLRSVARVGAELALEPGGKAVARLRDGAEVGVLSQKGKSTNVLLEGNEYWVVGWVATKDLSTQPSMLGKFGRGYGSGSGAKAGRQLGRACGEDVALYGELGKERRRIGTLRRDTAFLIETPKDAEHEESEHVQVTLPLSKWLWLRQTAKLTVYAADIRDCTAQTVSY